MPLPEVLLIPIPGPNPSWENLRYSELFEKIKEERRKDDTAPQGDWKFRLKEANYRSVVQLTSDALATRSKDLQLAAWLTEAQIHQGGFPGLADALDLVRALIEGFWETLYPELEDDDLELRAAPLSSIGEGYYADNEIRMLPLTKSGLDWFAYKQARSVPTEAEAEQNESKLAVRADAIAEGKLTPEEFETAVSETPHVFYSNLVADSGVALEALERLNQVCREKFGASAPNFRTFRTTIEEVQHTARILLEEKGSVGLPPEPPPPPDESHTLVSPQVERAQTPARLDLSEPADYEDAIRRIVGVTRYLRRENPYNPAPFLILRGLRWGELQASGSTPDPNLLEAPGTQVRQEIRRLSLEGQWEQLLEVAENAMGTTAGRAWLDLQRHVVRACTELGSYYEPIAVAVRSELIALLANVPGLPQMTLKDDTPTANPETLSWLQELMGPPAQSVVQIESEPDGEVFPGSVTPAPTPADELAPDAFERALTLARAGKLEKALETLENGTNHERSGRGKFRRRIQVARVFVASKKESIAYPILQELWREIEERRLDEWETPESVAEPLSLLFHCIEKLKAGAEEKQKVYSQICRLDPVQAAKLAK